MPLYTTAPTERLVGWKYQFGSGAEYWIQEKDTWWAEADFTKDDFTTHNPRAVLENMHFFDVTEVERGQPYTKPESVRDREQAVWAARGKGLTNGELICLRSIDHSSDGFVLGLRNSYYSEHHGSYIFRDKPDVFPGVGPDEYTSQFLPFTGSLKNGTLCSTTERDHFPSFALSFLVEAGGQFIIPLRGKAVDQYAGVPSLFSGGRIDGAPHKMVNNLVYSSAPAPIFGHAAGLLQREIGGDTDALDRERVSFLQLTGLQRAADLDVTLSGWGRFNYTPQEIESCMRTHGMLASEKAKYTGLLAVPATSDGVVQLLGMPFPPTVLPVIVYAAPFFDVDPQDILPNIKVIE